jgi:hypothetical protein
MSHGKVIQREGHIIPQINLTLCSPACVFYADCKNYSQNEPCSGFRLLENGNAVHRILQNLSENDKIYIERCMEKIPRTTDSEEKETLIGEVRRYLHEPEPQTTQHREGFLAMVEASRGTVERKEEKQEEQPPTSQFMAMLSESGKSNQPHTVVERQVQTIPSILFPTINESQFPDLCDPTKCPKDFARHCRANREEHFGKPCIYKTPKNR